MTKNLVLSLLVLICHAVQFSFGAEMTLIYESCHDQSSLCFGFPENCVASSNCQIVFRSQFEPASSRFQLELTAPSIARDKYVAVGFTNSTDMSGLVVYCTHSSNLSESVLRYGFNEYGGVHHNTQITNLKDVTGLINLESSYQDGQLQCRWQIEQPAQVQYNGLVFDFDGDKFYVQLATGPFDPAQNRIHYHNSNRVSSKSSVSLKRFPIQKSPERLAAEALEKRAVELVEVHKKSLKQLQNDSLQSSLVSAIESELILVEALITQLKTQISDTSKPLDHHNLLLLEEQLIRHELKLTEQLTAAQLAVIDQKKNEEAKNPVDPAKLVEKANELIKKGTDTLVSASSSEFSSIQLEIHEIEALVRAIQAKPSAPEFREDELLLERHERALQILIDRINGKNN